MGAPLDPERQRVRKRSLSPAQRGRLGGLTTASRHSPAEITTPARAAWLESFIPDDPELSDAERERRAKAARRLHFTRMAQRRWGKNKTDPEAAR